MSNLIPTNQTFKFSSKVEKLNSQPSLSCPATHVDSEKDNNMGKIANNIVTNSPADFGDKNNLSYSYKVPDQLEVGIFPCIFLVFPCILLAFFFVFS